ncbi:RNA 3'-terminal phosphate cyclase [Candidatus Woesearchaeota archaeon]|nr:RNA 3'-terminal phosphate cyclase [Candidatus Woesearchaeota archaeon]
MIEVDGSYHEGGGQILRTALGLSALTGQAFEAVNIRRDRPSPGLRPQHLSCVKAVAELCDGSFEGAEVSSSALKFYPRSMKSRTLSVDIGTAGSVTLLLQSLLLPVIFGGKALRVKVSGGTDVPFSPPSDYFGNVLLPHLRKFCSKVGFDVLRRGFVPAGGGRVEFSCASKFSLGDYGSFSDFLKGLRANPAVMVNLPAQGKLLHVKGSSVASADLQKAGVAERQAAAAGMSLSSLKVPVSISSSYSESVSTGSVIVLWAVFSDGSDTSHVNPVILGSSRLGGRGKRAEDVGREAASGLLQELSSKAPVDRHLADQLLPFLALAGGSFMVPELTPHCLAGIYTIEKFLGKCFVVDENSGVITVGR